MGSTVILSEVLEKLPLPCWRDRKILRQLFLFHSFNSGVRHSKYSEKNLMEKKFKISRKSCFMCILPQPSVWSCFGYLFLSWVQQRTLFWYLDRLALGNSKENISLYTLSFALWSPLPLPLLLLILLFLLPVPILLHPATFCGQHLSNGFCQWW